MDQPIEMLFGLWARMVPRNHVLDGGRQAQRDVAMATILVFLWVYIGATWQIRLNRPCAAAMRPYVKLITLTPC